jgi:hypothetical protein
VSRDTIAAAVSASRGISVQARAAPEAKERSTVNVRWSYTILQNDKAKETVSYTKPDDITGFLDVIRRDITARGGVFTGDEKSGSFSEKSGRNGSLSGSYTVTKNQITFVFEEQETQAGSTRGLADVFKFSFSKPADVSKALSQVKSEITKSKGNFSGDSSSGSFTAKGIAGNYTVADTVDVAIFQKPRIIPNSLIEKEVKNYFLAK